MPKIEELFAYCKILENKRRPYEKRWQEVVDYIHSTHADFTRKKLKGSQNPIPKWDDTASWSSGILAASFNNALTNKQFAWYQHEHPDKEMMKKRLVKEWFEDSQKIVKERFDASNFYMIISSIWQLGLDFGTSCGFFEDVEDSGRFNFKLIPLNEMYFEFNRFGLADKIYRKFKMKVSDIIDEWPKAKSSRIVQEAITGNQEHKEIEILHYCAPKGNYKTFNPDHQYISIFILNDNTVINSKSEIEYGGYHEQPYFNFFWDLMPDELYGTGIGINAMDDIVTLNATIELKFESLPLAINPPFKTTPGNVESIGDDGRIKSGGMIIVKNFDKFDRMPTGANLALTEMEEDKQRQKIKDHYYVDQLLLAPNRPEQTAYEIQQRSNIVYSILGKNAERAIIHVLQPIGQRAFNICLRAELFSDIPPELAGEEIKVEFVSPLAKAAKMQEINAINQFITVAGNLAPINPSILDMVDWFDLMETYANDLGMPTKLFIEKDKWKEIQKQKQEDAQMNQELQQAETGAGAMQRMGRAMQSMKRGA